MASPNPADLASHVRGVGRGTLATMLTRVADVAATYGYYAVVARSLSAADFGRFAFALAALQIAAAIARRGFDQALLAVPHSAAANRLAASRVAVASLGLVVIAAIAIVFWREELPPFVPVFIAGLPIVALAQLVIGALRARGSISMAATAESVSQPVGALLFAAAVAALAPTIANFAIAFVLSWALPLFFAARLEWRGARLERDVTSRLLTAGTSMLGVFLFQQAANSADILLLGVVAAPGEVAHYAIAQKIAAAFLVLHGAISNAAAPFIRELANDTRLLDPFRLMIMRWSLAAGVPLLVVTTGVPSLLLRLFGPDYVASSAIPLAIVSFAGLAYLLSGPAPTILLCTGRGPVLFRVTATGAIVLVLCVAAFAHLGAVGAAIGVALGTLLTRLMMVLMVRRYSGLGAIDASLATILGGAVAGSIAARLLDSVAGELLAAAAGVTIAVAIAIAVLRRNGDFGFLQAELLPRRAARSAG